MRTTASFGLLDKFKWLEPKEWDALKSGIADIEAEARLVALTSLRERVSGLPPFVDQSYRGASDAERLAVATISRAAVLAESDRALGEP